MRLLKRLTRATVSLLAGLTVLCVLAYAALGLAGFKPLVVYSGSMEPTLHVGSVVFERAAPPASLREGDVVTFGDPYVPGRLITHRIIRILRTKHGLAYQTKGDANPVRDPGSLRMSHPVGRFSFSVPVAGYALVYARSPAARYAALLLVLCLLLTSLPAPRRKRRRGPEAA